MPLTFCLAYSYIVFMKIQVPKQPRRNYFGRYLFFDFSLAVLIVVLFYCHFKQEYWLRGSLLL